MKTNFVNYKLDLRGEFL